MKFSALIHAVLNFALSNQLTKVIRTPLLLETEEAKQLFERGFEPPSSAYEVRELTTRPTDQMESRERAGSFEVGVSEGLEMVQKCDVSEAS